MPQDTKLFDFAVFYFMYKLIVFDKCCRINIYIYIYDIRINVILMLFVFYL